MAVTQSLATVAAVLVLGGCGEMVRQAEQARHNDTAREEIAREELRQLGRAYHDASDLKHSEAVESLDDLEATLARVGRSAGPVQAVREGRYTAVWGWKITDYGSRLTDIPFAWERDVPESGGMVVFGDGAVHYQTAEQFAAAPKFGEP